ncbi:MAG TPA: DEAD/DEAH box helicase, partial [Armatimonadota bacterium]|nr:DEAD/DEAH box helicase [Armatimonadota bacterium]
VRVFALSTGVRTTSAEPSALAKLFQDEEGGRCIICCPPKLKAMWDGYLQQYAIAGEVIPYSLTRKLREQRGRCRLLILDESHNLRNREAKVWAEIHDFVLEQDARVLLLSATPYNKHYEDLANQLRLALDEKADLGIRPEQHFREHQEALFRAQFQASPRSLVAFEQSDSPDDWRDLLRYFMVRRTRGFIIKNYAVYDSERDRYYLTLPNGIRSYFPKRVAITLKFPLQDGCGEDQYARLYNRRVVDTIADLRLPRYGLGSYIDLKKQQDGSKEEKELLENLSHAGKRLLGYCKKNLYKRLESSGYCFILSLRRHALRNLVFIHALDHKLDLPIGAQDSAMLDTALTDADPELELPVDEASEPESSTFTNLSQQAAAVYAQYEKGRLARKKQFQWIRSSFFQPELRQALLDDTEKLLHIVQEAGDWDSSQDAKLAKLAELLQTRERQSKVLIFTQFADTAHYLARGLRERGIQGVEAVTAASSSPADQVRRFSPGSNQYTLHPGETPIRVLVATEVLSEGQNCQDANVVVNYDLPWAIIRLIQRAGRVDRIGQDNAEIRIYSCLPADGVEDLIGLRGRLLGRLKQNREVIGTDEQFFDEELNDVNTPSGADALRDLYTEKDDLYNTPEDADDVDIASLAAGIWKKALEQDPSLEKKVRELPDQVHATRHQDQAQGALVYFKTADGFDSLLKVNREGQLVTQSLTAVLREAACPPDEEALPTHTLHHQLVHDGIRAAVQEFTGEDGALGPKNSARRRVYERLSGYRADLTDHNDLFTTVSRETLNPVVSDIFRHPLTERARDIFNRRLREGISDEELAQLAVGLRDENLLTREQDAPDSTDPVLICSIGLFPKKETLSVEER